MKLLTYFGLSTLPLIIIMDPFTVVDLFVAANTFDMATVTYVIKIILYSVQIFLDMFHADSRPKYSVLFQ